MGRAPPSPLGSPDFGKIRYAYKPKEEPKDITQEVKETHDETETVIRSRKLKDDTFEQTGSAIGLASDGASGMVIGGLLGSLMD